MLYTVLPKLLGTFRMNNFEKLEVPIYIHIHIFELAG